jgi:sec-independent protein translocase protein TatA
MLGNAFSGWHLLLILAVVLLLFGAARLPALARSVGQSARVFRKEVSNSQSDDRSAAGDTADAATAETPEANLRRPAG